MLRGQQDGTCEVYKTICFRTEKLEDNLRTHDSNFFPAFPVNYVQIYFVQRK